MHSQPTIVWRQALIEGEAWSQLLLPVFSIPTPPTLSHHRSTSPHLPKPSKLPPPHPSPPRSYRSIEDTTSTTPAAWPAAAVAKRATQSRSSPPSAPPTTRRELDAGDKAAYKNKITAAGVGAIFKKLRPRGRNTHWQLFARDPVPTSTRIRGKGRGDRQAPHHYRHHRRVSGRRGAGDRRRRTSTTLLFGRWKPVSRVRRRWEGDKRC
jgi:hypothetical protein